MRLNVILHGLVGFVHSPLPQMKAAKASVVKYKAGGGVSCTTETSADL